MMAKGEIAFKAEFSGGVIAEKGIVQYTGSSGKVGSERCPVTIPQVAVLVLIVHSSRSLEPESAEEVYFEPHGIDTPIVHRIVLIVVEPSVHAVLRKGIRIAGNCHRGRGANPVCSSRRIAVAVGEEGIEPEMEDIVSFSLEAHGKASINGITTPYRSDILTDKAGNIVAGIVPHDPADSEVVAMEDSASESLSDFGTETDSYIG